MPRVQNRRALVIALLVGAGVLTYLIATEARAPLVWTTAIVLGLGSLALGIDTIRRGRGGE
jgi:hypothetical protein